MIKYENSSTFCYFCLLSCYLLYNSCCSFRSKIVWHRHSISKCEHFGHPPYHHTGRPRAVTVSHLRWASPSQHHHPETRHTAWYALIVRKWCTFCKKRIRGGVYRCFFFCLVTESLGPNHVETFTATLMSMSKSKSSPHLSCLSMNRRSLKLRYNVHLWSVEAHNMQGDTYPYECRDLRMWECGLPW